MESIIGIGIFISVFFVRSFTTLIHELGHGIPALLFTEKQVKLYIGTYNSDDKTLHLNLGRLQIYFKYNLFMWDIGLCTFSGRKISINQNFIITLFGPLASLLFGLACLFLAIFGGIGDNLIIICMFFLVSCVMDFLNNIIPNNSPIMLDDGSTTYNDGTQLLNLLKYKKLPLEVREAVENYHQKEYKEALLKLENNDKVNGENAEVSRLKIACHIQLKNYEKARELMYTLSEKHEIIADDYKYAGIIKAETGQYEESVKYYQKALELAPENLEIINNIGYTLILAGDYESAIHQLNIVLDRNPKHPYALNNRGFAKIKQRDYTGKDDILKSIEIDKENAFAHRNLGIYFYDKKEYQEAIIHFEKAFELDSETKWLKKYMKKTKEKLKQ